MKTTINITEGTEKQIKYAESIRDEVMNDLQRWIDKFTRRGSDRAEKYTKIKTNIENNSNNNQATFWINKVAGQDLEKFL